MSRDEFVSEICGVRRDFFFNLSRLYTKILDSSRTNSHTQGNERSRFSLIVCICYRMIPAILIKVMGDESEANTDLQVSYIRI